MYRSRNRGRGNDVKGPNSALSQFLQEEGINAESIRQRWLDKLEKDKQQIAENTEDDDDSTVTESAVDRSASILLTDSENEEDEESAEPSSSRIRTVVQDSDEEEYDETDTNTKKTIIREVPDKETLAKKREKTKQVLQNRRKKRKRAANLLDKKDNEISTLQQMCLSIISKNISTWEKEKQPDEKNPLFAHLREVLGGISTSNMNNLGNALSKNRALDDETLQLFLKTDLKSLSFHDCSKISFEGYKTLAIFSPHLEELSLQMCGQLNNEALLYIAEKLPNLVSLKVDGPFLINEDTWIKFFDIMKGRLKEFHISNTHRFTDKNLSSLLTNCHEELVSLRFSRLDSVFNYAILPQYLSSPNFHTLAIEFPFNVEDVTDEVIINILGQIGSSLKHFILRECLELTDSVIVNGMNAFLSGQNYINSNLETLEMEYLDQITTDSLVYFFSQISLPSLKKFSLMRSTEVGDEAIVELLLNSAKDSLVQLNLNSLKNLTEKSFEMMRCDNLESLDVGFVRCVDDKVLEIISNQNSKLKLVEIFGDNLVSAKANISKNITLLGRQSDSI